MASARSCCAGARARSSRCDRRSWAEGRALPRASRPTPCADCGLKTAISWRGRPWSSTAATSRTRSTTRRAPTSRSSAGSPARSWWCSRASRCQWTRRSRRCVCAASSPTRCWRSSAAASRRRRCCGGSPSAAVLSGPALAARIPALRPHVVERVIETAARRNGVIATAVWIPGADMPLLTAVDMRMVLQIGVCYGIDVNADRAVELLEHPRRGLRPALRRPRAPGRGPAGRLGGQGRRGLQRARARSDARPSSTSSAGRWPTSPTCARWPSACAPKTGNRGAATRSSTIPVMGRALLEDRIEAVLETVQKPSRYIGGEANQVRKPQATALVALCYPDAYEVGISNQALQILYQQTNRREGVAAERVYCPWPDMADAMRREGLPLFTLESWRPVREADLLGITLQAELTYSNVLEVLDLAGIPLRAADRGEGDPIVVAGGPSASNPAPLAPFFDAVLHGRVRARVRRRARRHRRGPRPRRAPRARWPRTRTCTCRNAAGTRSNGPCTPTSASRRTRSRSSCRTRRRSSRGRRSRSCAAARAAAASATPARGTGRCASVRPTRWPRPGSHSCAAPATTSCP